MISVYYLHAIISISYFIVENNMPFEKRNIIDFNPPSLLNVYVTYIEFLKENISDYEASNIEKDAIRNSRYSQDRAAIWLNDYNMNQESSITNEARKTFFDELEKSDSNARNDIIRLQAQAFSSFLSSKFSKKIGDVEASLNTVSEQQAYHIFKDDKGDTHFEINSLTKITEFVPYMVEERYYLDNHGDLKKYYQSSDPKPEIGAYPFDMYQHLDLKFCWQKKSDLVSKIENILENNNRDKSTFDTSSLQFTAYQQDIDSLREFINLLSSTSYNSPYYLETRVNGEEEEEEVFFPEVDLKQSLSYDKYKPETEYLDLSIDPNEKEFNEIKFYKSIVKTLLNILDNGGVEEEVVQKVKENVVRQIKDLFLLNMKRDLKKKYYSSDIEYLNQMGEVIEQIEALVGTHEIGVLEFDINDMKYCIDKAFLPNDSDTPAARNRKLSYLQGGSAINEKIYPNRASFQAALNVRQDYKDAKTNTNIIKFITLFLSTLFFILAFLPLMTPLGSAGVIATATIFSLAAVITLSIGFKAYSQCEQLLQQPQDKWNFIKATRSGEFTKGSYKAIPQAGFFEGKIPVKGPKME